MEIDLLPRHIHNVIVETLSEVMHELQPRWEGERLARNVRKALRAMTIYEAVEIYAEAVQAKAH